MITHRQSFGWRNEILPPPFAACEGDGSTWGHVVIIEDLEEARVQEEHLARAERLAAVGEIAASLAHEIRNPLTVVRGAAALVSSFVARLLLRRVRRTQSRAAGNGAGGGGGWSTMSG